MGASFDIQHVNFISYITAEGKRRAPRTEEGILLQFLYSLGNQEEIQKHTISTQSNWQAELQQTASNLGNSLAYGGHEILDERQVAKLLDPLRKYFTGYQLYVLLVPSPNQPARWERKSSYIDQLFEKFVHTAKTDILVLMPYGTQEFINIVDPFPALQALAATPLEPPVALFWTKADAAVAMPLQDAEKFFDKNVANASVTEAKLNRAIAAEAKNRTGKRILHISDLHFGDPIANRRRNYLKQHLTDLASKVDQVRDFRRSIQ